MKRRYSRYGLWCALAISAGVFIYYQVGDARGAHSGAKGFSYLNVALYQPQLISRKTPFVFNAELVPIEQATIYARANGYVEEQRVDIGSVVKRGDVLAKLSSPELEEQIVQARQDVLRQKAELVLAEKLYERIFPLRDNGAVSASEIDERKAQKDVALAQLNTLKARLSQLEKEYAYTEIRAPFDGVITRRNVNRGDRITSTDTEPMYVLVQADELRVVVKVPQTLLYKIDLQADATFELHEKGGQAFPVAYKRQARAIDKASGTLHMEYALDNRTQNLPAGLSGKISIQPAMNASTVTVPANALIMKNGISSVMLVTEDNTVAVRPVKTGAYSNNAVAIEEGITADDKVILNPNALLKEGDKVQPQQQDTAM